jgi:hypothetical protein
MNKENIGFWFFILSVGGIFLRLSVSLLGYHGDLNNNISWGTIAYERGLSGFYEGYSSLGCENDRLELCEKKIVEKWPYSAPNQPPLTILLFALVRFVWSLIREVIWYLNWEVLIFPSRFLWFWDDKGMAFLIKLPSILTDLGIAVLIYLYALNIFKKDKKTSIFLASVWMLNPVSWYNSSVWGQTDSIVNFLGLVAIYFLIKKDVVKFSIFLGLTFLFKASLTIFVPFLGIYMIFQRLKIKDFFTSFFWFLFTIFVVSVWFHPRVDLFLWLVRLYLERIIPGEIGYLTANAFNFWWLVDSGKVYDSIYYFGIPARVWGISIYLIVSAFSILWFARKQSYKRFFAVLAILAISSFLFMTRIHERYLYPFFPVSTLLLAFDIPFWPLLYGAYSLIHLMNLYNLYWVPNFYPLYNALSLPWFTDLLAIANLLLFVLTLRQLGKSNI